MMRARHANRSSATGRRPMSLHARLDAAKLRVQKDLEASGRGHIPAPRRKHPDRTTRPDRIPPQRRRRAPVTAAVRPVAPAPAPASAPEPSESRAAYVAAPFAAETDTPPPTPRYRALLSEQDAQLRHRSELLDRLERELTGTVREDGGVATADRDARARVLQAEVADQVERRQQLLGALKRMPRVDSSPRPAEEDSPKMAEPNRPQSLVAWQHVPRAGAEDDASDQTVPDGRASLPGSPPPGTGLEEDDAIVSPETVSPRRVSTGSISSSDTGESASHSHSHPCVAQESREDLLDNKRVAERLSSLWDGVRLAVGSERDYSSLLKMVRDITTDFWEWINSCRRNGVLEGMVDFITLDDLHDDVAGCFYDNPVGPAQCRSHMKTVVSILESGGFRRSLQAQGNRRLTRCLSFDPTSESRRRLDIGREVIASELVRSTQRRASSKDGGQALAVPSESLPHHHSPEICGSDAPPTQDLKTAPEQREVLGETSCDLPSHRQSADGVSPGRGDGVARDPEQTQASVRGKTVTQTPSISEEAAVHTSQSMDSASPSDASPPHPEPPFHLQVPLKADADAAVEMLLDDLLDDVVLEMNRLERARGVALQPTKSTVPVAVPSKKPPQRSSPVDVTPLLQRLAELVQVEDQLVAKYEARRPRDSPELFAAPGSNIAPRHAVSANAPSTDKATAVAFVDARLALAARHRDRQLMIGTFQAWRLEAAEAPRLAEITFSLAKLKIKLVLPLWRRLAWARANARKLSYRHVNQRSFALLCRSTVESRNERVARSHRADVQLCQALMLWHAHVQEQQLHDQDLCATLASQIRINLIHQSWAKWQAAENQLLSFVHMRRSLALSSLRRWRDAVVALRLWQRRWDTIVHRVAFVSWRRFCGEASLVSARFQEAVLNRRRHMLQLHISCWRIAATEKRRLNVARYSIETIVKQHVSSFGLAALKYATLLNRQSRVLARRTRYLVWRAWLNEHMLVVHSKNRAFEAWKVVVGLARLETWLAHVRYTIHGRWVVVDCFYEWKRCTMIWLQGRNLNGAVERAMKSRYMKRWVGAFENRSIDTSGDVDVAGRSAEQDSSASSAPPANDTDLEPPGAQASRDVPSGEQQATGVNDLIEHRVAEVRVELANKYEALQETLVSQHRGLLADIKTDVGALNQRLAAFGVLSPATIDLLRHSATPQVQESQAVAVTAASPGIPTGDETSDRQSLTKSDVAFSQRNSDAEAAAEHALLAKLEEAESARKRAEDQAAAAMANEDRAAREFDAKMAAADAARIAAEEQEAAAVQARNEEARRAAVAATASAAKIEAAEAGRLVAENLRVAANREREEQVAAARQSAALEAAMAEQAALVASEAREAALKAEADRIREEAASLVAQATAAAEESQAQNMVSDVEVRRVAAEGDEQVHTRAEVLPQEDDRLAQTASSRLEHHSSRRDSEQGTSEDSAPEPEPLRVDALEPKSKADTSARITNPVESQVRRVVVQTSATVKPLGDHVSALQLRKEQLRKEQMAEKARAESRNNRQGQTQFARQSSVSDYDDWGAATSASSRRLARRADAEPLFPTLGDSTQPENASERATAELAHVASHAVPMSTSSVPNTPNDLRADGAGAQLEPSVEVGIDTPTDTKSVPLEQKTEEDSAAAAIRADDDDHQPHDHSGRNFGRRVPMDPAAENLAMSSTDVDPVPAAADDVPSTTVPGSRASDADVDVESSRSNEKDAIADDEGSPAAASAESTATNEKDAIADDAESPADTDFESRATNEKDTIADDAEAPEDREIRLKFEELDTDNSGALDANELAQLIKELLDTDEGDASKKKSSAKQEQKRLRKLEKKALELASGVLKEMDEDGSGEISLEEFSKWWKEYRQKKSKGMFRGLFGKRKKTAKREPQRETAQQPLPRFFGASLSSILGKEPPESSTPAFVQTLMERLDGVIATLTIEQICPNDGPSQQAIDRQRRLESEEDHSKVLQSAEPSVCGQLLVAFLRDLQEPVIPAAQRADCLKLGRDSGASRDATALREIVQWMGPLMGALPKQNCAFLVDLFAFLRRQQNVEVERLAEAFAPAIFRDLSAADRGGAQTFVEFLLLAPWNPALPTITRSPAGSGDDSSNSTPDAEISSPQLPAAEVVSIGSDDSSTAGVTGTGWQRPMAQGTGSLFSEDYDRTQPLPTTQNSTSDDDSRMTAPESTAVESFKMSPPSTHAGSPDGVDTATTKPTGPAWTTQLDSEDVLSSLEFANTKPMFRTAGDDMIIDDEIDDLELEEIETL